MNQIKGVSLRIVTASALAIGLAIAASAAQAFEAVDRTHGMEFQSLYSSGDGKAQVVANNHGDNWDKGLSKEEKLNFITKLENLQAAVQTTMMLGYVYEHEQREAIAHKNTPNGAVLEANAKILLDIFSKDYIATANSANEMIDLKSKFVKAGDLNDGMFTVSDEVHVITALLYDLNEIKEPITRGQNYELHLRTYPRQIHEIEEFERVLLNEPPQSEHRRRHGDMFR
jgi:hypothetical protein